MALYYRIYDDEREEWVAKDVYLAPNGDLVAVKQIMGLFKAPIILDRGRFICHRSIGLQDVNEVEVFEGDYIRAIVDEDKSVTGLVVFAEELSAYIILIEETNEYYTLGCDVSELIEVVGNVFDGIGDKKYN